MTIRRRLYDFLCDHLELEELRRICALDLEGGDVVVRDFPGPSASPSEGMWRALDALLRHGVIADEALWDALARARPRCREEIRALRGSLVAGRGAPRRDRAQRVACPPRRRCGDRSRGPAGGRRARAPGRW
ncbi:MAG: hypothetical protein R3B09_00905 [Nannocystaceae bacterium]